MEGPDLSGRAEARRGMLIESTKLAFTCPGQECENEFASGKDCPLSHELPLDVSAGKLDAMLQWMDGYVMRWILEYRRRGNAKEGDRWET